MDCLCGSKTATRAWCRDGKHARRSTKPQREQCSQCSRKHYGRGLCQMHYMRLYRAGAKRG